jgi:hypothetical protein
MIFRKTIRLVCYRCKRITSERRVWFWDFWYDYHKSEPYYEAKEIGDVLLCKDFCLSCVHERDPRTMFSKRLGRMVTVAGFPGEEWIVGTFEKP